MGSQREVTIVSHGPNCLDGLTCALVASRYFEDRRCNIVFPSNRSIDDTLLEYSPADPASAELWVTDISWQGAATDRHLSWLVECGLELYWLDHHRSAMEARKAGRLRCLN